ncbi:MAG TPA: cupin domain-containing protein [Planctomycetota bacterium]|jgi:quercetin dioxygenase-like cupin family protein
MKFVLALLSLAFATAMAADVPAGEAPAKKTIVSRPADYKTIKQDWGELTWFVSGEQKNCDALTVGKATIKPGCESPRHYHPNCTEVLHVLKGKIVHAIEDGKTVEMSEGDTITIPPNLKHNAKNVGTENAVMLICFSTADRKAVNE